MGILRRRTAAARFGIKTVSGKRRANEDDGRVEVVSSEPVRADEWNRVVFVNDLRQAVLSLNGVASPSVAVPARRVYGNCEVVLGGCRDDLDAYVGALRGLTVE